MTLEKHYIFQYDIGGYVKCSIALNSTTFQHMRSIAEIIKAAGGPVKIAEASNGAVTAEAVYKWPKIGIPDRHWSLVMPLAGADPDEMFKANLQAREAAA